MSKAFDTVNRHKLVEILEEIMTPDELHTLREEIRQINFPPKLTFFAIRQIKFLPKLSFFAIRQIKFPPKLLFFAIRQFFFWFLSIIFFHI